MGTIPRKLKQINGFVECKFGSLPYEDEEDRIKLMVYAAIYDSAVSRGTIYKRSDNITPRYRENSSETERRTTDIILAHALKNIQQVRKRKIVVKLRSNS